MDLGLTGKRALVTGSTSGLGEATVRMLAEEGASVIVHGRDLARAELVATSIVSSGGKADIAIGDLTTDAGADAVVAQSFNGGGVDILINNAGFYHHLTWTTASADKWLETYQINVVSGVRMVQRLVPWMRDRGWGRVIQIGGGLAQQPIAMLPDYNASLAARHNLTVSLARELKDSGVTANVVAPGAILVPAVRAFLEDLAKNKGWSDNWEEIERRVVRELIPNDIGRLGRPREIAAAVAYLASMHADYISGATLRVDGGTIRAAF